MYPSIFISTLILNVILRSCTRLKATKHENKFTDSQI